MSTLDPPPPVSLAIHGLPTKALVFHGLTGCTLTFGQSFPEVTFYAATHAQAVDFADAINAVAAKHAREAQLQSEAA